MAVNVGMKKSSGNLEKWPSHLETVDKPSNPPIYTPNKDMALIHIIHKEVDTARDPRLDVSQLELIRSPDNDIGIGGFLDKDIKLHTLSNVKRDDVNYEVHALSSSIARDRHISRRKSSRTRGTGNDRSNKLRIADISEWSGSTGAFETMDRQSPVSTRKEMKPLQLQNTTAAKKQSVPGTQIQSIQQSKKKGKEDLDEILRKRLEELEAQLSMMGSEPYLPHAEEVAEDVTKGLEIDNGKRLPSANSRTEKKRKTHNESDAGDSKFAKRFRTSDDDPARIIAANIDGSMTNGSDAKLDQYISTILKNETGSNEGLSSMSADFSDEISSMIQSNFWEHSPNDEFGQLLSSSSAEQLVDTETIMLNVLSQNLPDTRSSPPPAPTKNDDVLPEVVDNHTATVPHQSVQPKLEVKENGSDLERHKEGQHIGCLSVDTQWDSQFVESFVVKSTHLNTVRDWRNDKMLDLLISGRLKEIPGGTSSELRHEGTDKLVANSLQNILSNISWLWNVAVGDNMLDSMQDVVSNTAINLDSLMIDFVEHSGCIDIPLSVRLSNDRMVDDATDAEVAVKQEMNKEDDWLHEESLLLEGLATSLDDTREKMLNQKHAVNSTENTHSGVPDDLYSPTRPTEMDLSSSCGDSGVRRPKGVSQAETGYESQLLQSVGVSDSLHELVENAAPSRRIVRIHKKENATAKSSSGRIKGAVPKGRHANSSSEMNGLRISEEDLGNVSAQISDIGFASDKPVAGTILESNLSDSGELQMNQFVEIPSIMDVELGVDGLPSKQIAASKQTQDTTSADRQATDLTGEFRYAMDSEVATLASHKSNSFKKHSTGSEDVFGKSRSYRTGVKKDGHSHKRRERVNVAGKKSKKKTRDVAKLFDRQLKSDVKSELDHVQKIIESLLCDKYGINLENSSRISHDVSLHAIDKHLPILSGIAADGKVALINGVNDADDIVKAVSLTPLLNDVLTELSIPLSSIHLTLPENASVNLTDRLVGQKSSEVRSVKKSQVESPSSPPSMRRSTVKQTSVPRRNKSSEESGVNIIPHRRREATVTENEKRLMKADKLMQTFRRSQIAKRQSQITSPQPPASFMKQVQTIKPSEGLKLARSDSVDSYMAVLSSEVKEPDFSMVITDGSMLASVELPQSLPPPNAVETPEVLQASSPDTTPVTSQALSSEFSQATEVVHVSTAPVLSSETTVTSSTNCKVGSVITHAGKEQRVYVFNVYKPLCREVEETLVKMAGTRTFDPYNVVLLRSYNQLDCRVFVHSDDVTHVHSIPNLLRLKRDLRVSFLVYEAVENVKYGSLKSIFPRGGLAIMDTGTLIGCPSEILGSICEFMLKQTKERNMPWLLMIVNNTVEELHRLRAMDADNAIEYSRKAAILAQFQASGVIQMLPEELSRPQRRCHSVDDYLQYFIAVQSQFIFRHRHFLFVSGMSRTHSDARSFVARGVDVLSVPEFVRGFVGQAVTAQLQTHPEYTLEHTSDVYSDAALSDGAESVMNKWTPPRAVTISS